MNTQPLKMPVFPIDPKISGQGVVIKKDGSISKPEQPKEKEHGSNTGKRD